ncbi:hypothetical protein CRYUN_Cryun05aG0069000 [Craigia yunnanensis]
METFHSIKKKKNQIKRVRGKVQLEMAGICGPNLILHLNWTTTQSPLNLQRVHGARCCSATPENENKTKTPQFLRLAVNGVTELLRLFSSSTKDGKLTLSSFLFLVDDELNTGDKDGISVSDVADVLRILESDYENAYFVTGYFTPAIYAEDCILEDPTIRFRG